MARSMPWMQRIAIVSPAPVPRARRRLPAGETAPAAAGSNSPESVTPQADVPANNDPIPATPEGT